MRFTTAALAVAGAFLASASGARALPGPTGPTFAVEPFFGVLALDEKLTNYGWDTPVRPVWGATLRAGLPRFDGGARVWTSSATQVAGFPGADLALDVRLLGVEGFLETRVASLAGFDLRANGRAGWLRLGWSPDRVEVDAGGDPISVAFDPIVEPSVGLGVALRRGLPAGFALAAEVDHAWFALDTAHRRGAEIVESRETFTRLGASVAISRRILPF